jgi:TolB-like protein/Flp pilus assembly protein TadD
MSFFAELKRRNVIRVAIGYLAVSWLLLQAGSLVFGLLDLPNSVPRGLFALLIIGFLPALVFSWVYELTPEGLKRTSEVDRGDSITHLTGRKLDYLVIGVLAAAVALLLVDKFALAPRREAAELKAALEREHATGFTTNSAVPGASTAPPALAQAAIPEIDKDPSIAVLPFINLSSDKEQEYFSDGISEELLNLLAKIPKLRVIARTSSFAFKGERIDIAEVARKLHVAAVLEGSVRKSANHVRITAQLIRAADSTHLWSETYDRTLDDIFKVQDEIAAAVVGQLKIKLLGAAPTARPVDPRVYPLLLQAKALVDQGSSKGRQEATALYQEALKIVPDEARAWDGLAKVYIDQTTNAGERPVAESFALAREAANKALEIDPADAAAYATRGRLTNDHDGDLAGAARDFQRALELDPSNPDVLSRVAISCLRPLGRLDDAIAIQRYLIARDPASSRDHFSLGYSLYNGARWDDAIASLRTALALAPQRNIAHYLIGAALLAKGETEAALVEMQAEPSESWRLQGLALAFHAVGRKADSDNALSALVAKDEHDASYNIAGVYSFRGEADRAFESLDKAVTYRDPGLTLAPIDPLFAKIHDDPRWQQFLRKTGHAPEQLAKIEFKVTLPEQAVQ